MEGNQELMEIYLKDNGLKCILKTKRYPIKDDSQLGLILHLNIYIFRMFQLMTVTPDDSFLLSDQDINRFLV